MVGFKCYGESRRAYSVAVYVRLFTDDGQLAVTWSAITFVSIVAFFVAQVSLAMGKDET